MCVGILVGAGSAAAAPAIVATTSLPPDATAFSVTVDPGTGRVYASIRPITSFACSTAP
jgi:hypothetical protein